MNRTRSRQRNRCLSRRLGRPILRRCVRATADRHRGPDELSQALTAYRRAIRCHQRLARLAPRFFDSTIVDREAHERAERRHWMQTWEPLLAKVYDCAPDYAAIDAMLDSGRPSLPPRRTQRVVERELAGWDFWLTAAHSALERYYRRRPHALPDLNQISRVLEISSALQRLACGSFQPDPSQAATAQAEMESALRRAYPVPGLTSCHQRAADILSADQTPHTPAVSSLAVGDSHPAVTASSSPAWPPPDDKRDLTPYAIVRGEHGLLCLQRIESE